MTHKIFPYSWHIDEQQEEITIIRIYGLNEKNQSVSVTINDFTPYIYLELPEDIEWNETRANMLGKKIDDICGKFRPLKKCLSFKKKLYYANVSQKRDTYTYQKFPFLMLSFSSPLDIKKVMYRLNKPIIVSGIGNVEVKIHEQDANAILQLVCVKDIPTAGWFYFKGTEIVGYDKETYCKHEYVVKWKNIARVKSEMKMPLPLIMGFDIEVNSTNPNAMPNAKKPGDKVFQISCVLSRPNDTDDKFRRFLLTLGSPESKIVGDNVEILTFDTECELLTGFTKFITKYNPQLIVGYNILNFDIPYMIERAKSELCMYEFDQMSCRRYHHAPEKLIKWSSSAYKNQEFQFLDAEGRLFVDLLPLVKRDYKFNNYKLKTISDFFLGETKDPLTPKGIFKCYREGMKRNKSGEYTKRARKAMSVVGKYCVQDTVLCNKLVEVLQTWVGLCEMASTCNVPIFYLYTQGQQIKVYSQVYKYCMKHNIIVEKDGYKASEDESYTGATVFPPEPGAYDKVVPFDFSSLYPTTIIAYNIDYSTLVRDDDSIPDSDCNVIEWEDHIGCIAKGTKITIGEFSEYIENLNNHRNHILGYNENLDGMTYFNQTNFYNQGIKECIELTFNDGDVLKCTPDHKILTMNGWKQACDIELNNDLIKCTYLPPVFNVPKQQTIGSYTFDHQQTIIFYKILGLLCTDGYCAKGRTVVYCGHQIDLKNIIRDIQLISNDNDPYRVFKVNYGWGVTIKGTLGDLYRNLPGIIWGKKSNQIRTFPTILKLSSKGEIGCFLSGLFGGDGHTFSYSEKSLSFGSISLSWTSINQEYLTSVFNEIKHYLSLFDIDTSIVVKTNYTIINILNKDVLKFKTNIGFSYCVHKSMRLELGCSYIQLKSNVFEQQKYLIDQIKTYKQHMTKQEAIKKAVQEINEKSPIYNKYYSNPSLSQVTELLRTRKEWKKPMFSFKHFPSPVQYMKMCNSCDFFNSYAVDSESSSIPYITKTIIHKKNIGLLPTYDLEVNKAHSFIANSVIVHNCSHDTQKRTVKPKTTICAHRRYRFLKEPKGVMPSLLEFLLNARKETRKEIKNIKGSLKDCDDDKKCEDMNTRITVLNKRQLAYKVSANSVGGYTPILCKKNGHIVYLTIEELSKGDWSRINDEQEVSTPIENVYVWSDKGFTKPKFVMRHPQEKPLNRVITHTGLVDCTDDHSLLSPDGTEVTPNNLKIGDDLMHYQYPLPKDTPKIAKHVNFQKYHIKDEEQQFYKDGCIFYEMFYEMLRNSKYTDNCEFLMNTSYNNRIAFILGFMFKNKYSEQIILSSNMYLSAFLMYMFNSVGYFVKFVNNNCLKLFSNNKNQTNNINSITYKYKLTSNTCKYVYDIETENHHFAAGIGHMIVHNSMYGAMGVRRGYLPFLPGAMCTTAQGRKSIEKAAHEIQHNYGAKLVYGDSVTGDTPVLCRKNGEIFYCNISDLGEKYIYSNYYGDKEQIVLNGVEVWTERGFTKINKVIRHYTEKKIFQVLCHTGVVNVTEDHSLLDTNSEKISPKDIQVGNELLTHSLPEITVSKSFIFMDRKVTPEICYVMGLFYADGSCGKYECKSGKKSSWAINNSNINLLENCKNILIKFYENINFKILDTESCVYKLVVNGTGIVYFVDQWRQYFYCKKWKQVPNEMLQESRECRQSFLDGYYASDGDKDKNGYFRFDNKGQIGSAGLYFIANSLGYNVSINTRNDKFDIYRMTCTKNNQRKKQGLIKRITEIKYDTKKYVYDLETENHHFSAGPGQLIVHNTDSAYVHFPKLKTAAEIWDYCFAVEKEMYENNVFPKPMKLEFEEVIYWRFFILTKKRYMALSCGRDGQVSDKIMKKGVLLARRDNSKFIRDIYEKVIMMIFNKSTKEDVLYEIIIFFNLLCSYSLDLENFVITKSVGETGDYKIRELPKDPIKRVKRLEDMKIPPEWENMPPSKNQSHVYKNKLEEIYILKSLPSQVQLAEKMRRRGKRVDAGSRMEYVITDTGNIKDKVAEKIEDPEYQKKYGSLIKIDHLYYIKLSTNPLDQALFVGYKVKDFVLGQYKLRCNKYKMMEEIREMFDPKIKIVGEPEIIPKKKRATRKTTK